MLLLYGNLFIVSGSQQKQSAYMILLNMSLPVCKRFMQHQTLSGKNQVVAGVLFCLFFSFTSTADSLYVCSSVRLSVCTFCMNIYVLKCMHHAKLICFVNNFIRKLKCFLRAQNTKRKLSIQPIVQSVPSVSLSQCNISVGCCQVTD